MVLPFAVTSSEQGPLDKHAYLGGLAPNAIA